MKKGNEFEREQGWVGFEEEEGREKCCNHIIISKIKTKYNTNFQLLTRNKKF